MENSHTSDDGNITQSSKMGLSLPKSQLALSRTQSLALTHRELGFGLFSAFRSPRMLKEEGKRPLGEGTSVHNWS